MHFASLRFISVVIAFVLLSALIFVAKAQSEGEGEALIGDKLELKSRLRYATTQLAGAQAENTDLKELIGHLRNDLAGKVIKVSTLNDQLSNLEVLHEQTAHESARLKKSVDDLQRDLATQVIAGSGLREEFERLASEFQYQKGENARLNDLLTEIKKALEKKENILNRLLVKLARSKIQFDQLEGRLNKDRQALDDMTLRYEEETLAKAALGKTLEVSRTENIHLHRELMAATKRINVLRGDVTALNDEMGLLYERIESLREEQTRQQEDWKAKRTTLEEQLAQREGQLADMKKSWETSEARALSATNQRNGLLFLLAGVVIGGFILWRRHVSRGRESV